MNNINISIQANIVSCVSEPSTLGVTSKVDSDAFNRLCAAANPQLRGIMMLGRYLRLPLDHCVKLRSEDLCESAQELKPWVAVEKHQIPIGPKLASELRNLAKLAGLDSALFCQYCDLSPKTLRGLIGSFMARHLRRSMKPGKGKLGRKPTFSWLYFRRTKAPRIRG